MIDTLARWHDYVRTHDAALLDGLLADDVVFESPVVFKPQRGKAIATSYLRTADVVLGGDAFRYVHTWTAPGSAVLEFESVIDGVTVNGVDIVTWGEDGKIVHFKVMVRPLQAVNAIHRKMGEMLAAAAPASR